MTTEPVNLPVNLSEYRMRRGRDASATAVAFGDDRPNATSADDLVVAERGVLSDDTGLLSAAVLRKLDPDADLGRFFDATEKALQCFQTCSRELASGHNLAADSELMTARQSLGELFMLREYSDAIGVIAVAALEATSKVVAVIDAPNLPVVCEEALRRLWNAPFMNFADAAALAQSIEDTVTTEGTAAFNALVDELLEAQDDTPTE